MKQPMPVFNGDIVKGKLKLFGYVKKSIALWCSTFKDGTKVDIIIRKHKKNRSNQQNKYYYSVVIPILADYFRHDNPEDMHEDLKLKFNPIESKIDKNKIIGGSTTKLSTIDFYSADTSYIERIVRWAASEYGIYIPPPKKAEEG